MLIVVGNGQEGQSSKPELDCILHSANTLGKGMHPRILSPAMGK